jgi:hypothetical protein
MLMILGLNPRVLQCTALYVKRFLCFLFGDAINLSVIRLLLIAFLSSSVNAEQPSRKGCVAVSKSNMNSALERPFPRYPYERCYLRSRLDYPQRLTRPHCHPDRSSNLIADQPEFLISRSV